MRNASSSPCASTTCSATAAPSARISSILQVGDADIETASLHLGARQVDAEAAALQTSSEVRLFSGVAHTGQSEVQPLWAVSCQEASNVRRAADGHDGKCLEH